MESHLNQKIELRKAYLALQKAISKQRREEASQALLKSVFTAQSILSFYSMPYEIELKPLNQKIISQGKLLFNRLEEGILIPYFVTSLDLLSSSPMGFLEPDPKRCKKASFSEIELILVPGLSFDQKGFRLGRGKGHYDRLLGKIGQIPTKGVGFIEQFSQNLLPRDPWDLPVQELLLT